jgi:hypothetical protein
VIVIGALLASPGEGTAAKSSARGFLVTLPQYPFQQGSSLNAANINYTSLQAMQAMN